MGDLAVIDAMAVGDRAAVDRMQVLVSTLPQYEPVTRHYFHGGMYCREVFREAGVMVVGKVHLKEHFYVVASGKVLVTTDGGARMVTGPAVIKCSPGTKRAAYSATDATTMTFHVTNAKTVAEAEAELVEADDVAMFGAGNTLRSLVLADEVAL
jgi:acetyl-CoA carboxylase carboxyltransferase component